MKPSARLWLGALALLAAVAGLAAPIHPGAEQVLWRLGMDVAHIPLFCGLTLALAWGSRPFLGKWSPVVATLAGFALVGLAELLQPLVGRSSSWDDAINGVVGIGLAGLFLAERGSRLARLALLAQGALLCLMLVYSLAPIYRHLGALAWQERAFPVLAEFREPAPYYLWLPQPDEGLTLKDLGLHYRLEELGQSSPWLRLWRDEGTLRLSIQPGHDFTGASLPLHGRARDWSGQDALVLEIDNLSGGRRVLGIRIDDDGDVSRLGGRFQSALDLQPGPNTLRVPLAAIEAGPRGRRLNPRRIRRLALFTGVADPQSHSYRVKSVRLSQ